MSITATQLKENLSLYLSQASNEDVVITSHGRVVAVLISPAKQKQIVLQSLQGILPSGVDINKILSEKISQI